MPATWPASVPFIHALRDLSYSGPLGDRVVFEPDVGPPLARRRSTAGYRALSGATPVLDATQRAAFESFWETDLAGGTLSFTATNPVSGAMATFQPDGSGYSVQPVGAGKVRISLSLWELPS